MVTTIPVNDDASGFVLAFQFSHLASMGSPTNVDRLGGGGVCLVKHDAAESCGIAFVLIIAHPWKSGDHGECINWPNLSRQEHTQRRVTTDFRL
jgi:hypothetical protein